jgi:hypothetical protein
MLIVTRESDRPLQAPTAPACPGRPGVTASARTLAKLPAGFGISVGTAHSYTTAVVDLLAELAPGLLRASRETDPDYVLLDGTLAECDQVGDNRGRLPPTSTADTG